MKRNKVLAAKASRGSVSLRRYHVLAPLSGSTKYAALTWGEHFRCTRVVVCWEAHVKCKSRRSCSTSEEGTWTFLVNADFVLRSVAGLITYVCDFRQLAFWHGKQLTVGWLPAKVKGCVDKVVILKTYFFLLFVFFIYFANIYGAKQAFLWRFQRSHSIFLSLLPLLAAQTHLVQMILAGVSKSFL